MSSPSPSSRSVSRWRPRFSLGALLCFVMLVGSWYGLWLKREPWALEHTLRGHSDIIWSPQFSRDGRHVVSGSDDGTARVWDVDSERLICSVKAHNGRVNVVNFSPDGKKIITGGPDSTARIWDAVTGKELLVLEAEGWVQAVLFLPDGKCVLTAGHDYKVTQWDAVSGNKQKEITGHTSVIFSTTLSPDGTKLLTSGQDDSARLCDLASGQLELSLHDFCFFDAEFSPDGRKIATASKDSVRIWDTSNGRLIRGFTGHTDYIWNAAFSPEGTRLATGSYDKTAMIWDVQTGKELYKFSNDIDEHTHAIFSPDGQRVMVTTKHRDIQIWRYVHREDWSGFFTLPETWLAISFSVGLLYSLFRIPMAKATKT